jgi:hypothetical protein
VTALIEGTSVDELTISRDSEELRRHEDDINAIHTSLHRTLSHGPHLRRNRDGGAVGLWLEEVNGTAGHGGGGMNSELSKQLIDSLTADRLRAAERFRRAGARTAGARTSDTSDPDPVTVRLAHPDDAPVVARLAQLEGRSPLNDPTLVAEVDGVVHAARSLYDGTSVADPFRRTAHLTALLAVRARHVRKTHPPRPRRHLMAWLRARMAWR